MSQREKGVAEKIIKAPVVATEVIAGSSRIETPDHEIAPKMIADEPLLIEQMSREAVERMSVPNMAEERVLMHDQPMNSRSAKETSSHLVAAGQTTLAESASKPVEEEAVTWVALPKAVLVDLEDMTTESAVESTEFIASDEGLAETVVEEEAEALLLQDLRLPEVMIANEWAIYFTETELPLFPESEGFEAPEEVCPVPHDAAPETDQYVTEFETFIAPYLPESVAVEEEDVMPLAQDLLYVARVYQQAEAGSEQADEAAQVLGQLCGKLFERLSIDYNEAVINHFVQAVIEHAPLVRIADEELDIDLLNHYGTHEYKAGDIGSIWQALAQVLQHQFESCKSIGRYVLRSLSAPAAA